MRHFYGKVGDKFTLCGARGQEIEDGKSCPDCNKYIMDIIQAAKRIFGPVNYVINWSKRTITKK